MFSCLLVILIITQIIMGYHKGPPIEQYHDKYWNRERLPTQIAGSTVEVAEQTPDYREEEGPLYADTMTGPWYNEEERAFRLSPFYKNALPWSKFSKGWFRTKGVDQPFLLGCYCTTVYKRLTLLAGCAVITTRHILTTATSTELILRTRNDAKTLDNILGAWYDHDGDTFNSSMYMTPARIHYHPKYISPENVNITHPLPCVYDLAVWAATHQFNGGWFQLPRAYICQRGASHRWDYRSSTHPPGWLSIVVGFQFMKAQMRNPTPFHKYAIRTRKNVVPCPKTEWGWFHCVADTYWAKYGLESGAALHRCMEGHTWSYDGLIGLCAFSMKLRSDRLIHYFTVLNTHPVLDFLYDSYMGRLPYRWLDWRFYDSQWRAPVPKSYFQIPQTNQYGEEIYSGYKQFIY